MSDKKYKEWLELMKDTPKEEILKYHYKLLFKVDKQKEVLDKINKILESDLSNMQKLVAISVYLKKDKLLEEIE